MACQSLHGRMWSGMRLYGEGMGSGVVEHDLVRDVEDGLPFGVDGTEGDDGTSGGRRRFARLEHGQKEAEFRGMRRRATWRRCGRKGKTRRGGTSVPTVLNEYGQDGPLYPTRVLNLS